MSTLLRISGSRRSGRGEASTLADNLRVTGDLAPGYYSDGREDRRHEGFARGKKLMQDQLTGHIASGGQGRSGSRPRPSRGRKAPAPRPSLDLSGTQDFVLSVKLTFLSGFLIIPS